MYSETDAVVGVMTGDDFAAGLFGFDFVLDGAVFARGFLDVVAETGVAEFPRSFAARWVIRVV